MFDNPKTGSNTLVDAVSKMQEGRAAEQPEPIEDASTGGTEDAGTHQNADNFELEAEQDGVEEREHSSESDESDFFTVKINGEEKQVSLDDLKSGYMMQSDYTRKTMAHADEVRALEEQKSQFDSERAEKLQQLESFIEQQESSIDWDDLRDTDPAEYIRFKELQKTRREAAQKERSELEDKQAKLRQEAANTEGQRLVDAMGPAWEQKQRLKDFEDAAKYLDTIGIKEEDMSNIIDHRLWLAIFDAMKFRSLEARKDIAAKEVREAPKSVKPGRSNKSASQTEVDEAIGNLRNAEKFGGSVNAAMTLMKAKRNRKGK